MDGRFILHKNTLLAFQPQEKNTEGKNFEENKFFSNGRSISPHRRKGNEVLNVPVGISLG